MPRPVNPFQFKRFSIADSRCSMKVGTDGVLLGAWTEIKDATKILDIGTGSGLIALMLAQRSASAVLIDAVEIEVEDFNQACENFYNSPWSSQINAYRTSIQEFKPNYLYDLIVTNPPYFSNSYLPATGKRSVARHTQTLSHSELLAHACALLAPNGRLCLVLPTAEGDQFQTLAKTMGLYPSRKTSFFSREGKPQERWLFEFTFNEQKVRLSSLVLYDSITGGWTSSYHALTNDFYLEKNPSSLRASN